MNESRYDVAEIRGGRVADAVQVKFVGADAKECLTLLHSNVCTVISGDKDADAALRDVAKDTASGAEAGQAIIPVPVVGGSGWVSGGVCGFW